MKNCDTIEIDGSQGEGGGQIIRTALSLSVITGKAFTITGIRAGRRQTGLKEQHLTCVRACSRISQAVVEGDCVGSSTLTFIPGEIRSGNYHFDISTAGSTSLVFQCVFFPLAMAHERSSISITGGTHVLWSPSFDYLRSLWLPMIGMAGFDGDIALERAGYFPAGGGKITAHINPAGKLRSFRQLSRGRLEKLAIFLGSSNLPSASRERMKKTLEKSLKRYRPLISFQEGDLSSCGRNAFTAIHATFEHSQACFTDVGERGKPSEDVAVTASNHFLAYMEREGALDEHMSDQILIPLALVPQGNSVYTTSHVSQHLLTNADIIRKFLDVTVEIDGEENSEGKITVRSNQNGCGDASISLPHKREDLTGEEEKA